MPEKSLEALRFLPRKRETWQGGLVRMPMWVTGEAPGPYRPWGGVWVSLGSSTAHIGESVPPGEKSPEQVLESFLELALDGERAGYLPERVEVAGEEAAALMEQTLAPLQVTVTRKDRVFGVESFLDALAQAEGEGSLVVPGILEPPGMTVERVASFAEAARLFYQGAPWHHLSSQDLLRIEGKGFPSEFRHAIVMGAGGQEFGLLLFEKPALHQAMISDEASKKIFGEALQVSVFFGPIYELPLQDADLFMDHGLPVAGPKAYPWTARFGPKRRVRRLNPASLAQVEAILRALAATTEPEIDGGRWTRLVPTPDGAVEVTLVLPGLVEPPKAHTRRAPGEFDRRSMERTMAEIQRFVAEHPVKSIDEMNRMIQDNFMGRPADEIPSTAATPPEKAQEICYQACEVRGRRRVHLARQALEIDPDCAEAYVILAEQSGDPAETLRLYGEGVAAGERSLGPKRFKSRAPFWGDVTTRPFMRALQGLAECCETEGRLKEALAHYQRLLRLNPNDNQGVRDPLAGLLLRVGDDAGLAALLKQYQEDGGPTLLFAAALREFRRSGDSKAGRKALSEGIEANPHVPDLLLGRMDFPAAGSSSYTLGSVEEAEECALLLIEAWKSTPGAIEWLEKNAGKPRRSPKPRSRA